MSTKVIPPKEILEATIGGLSVLIVTGGSTGDVLTKQSDGTYVPVTPSAASGDVVGPASATDNAIARFDATTGKLVQNSSATISDTGSYFWYVTTGMEVYSTGVDWRYSGVNRLTFDWANNLVSLDAMMKLSWSATSGDSNAVRDVGLVRSAAGVLKVHNGSTGDGSLIVGCYTSSTVGFTVKAAASQSANLTEWQSSSGNVGMATDANTYRMKFYPPTAATAQDTINIYRGASTSTVALKIGITSSDEASFDTTNAGYFFKKSGTEVFSCGGTYGFRAGNPANPSTLVSAFSLAGTGTGSVRFIFNNVANTSHQTFLTVAKASAPEITGAADNDFCIVNTAKAIRFSTNGGTTDHVSIAATTGVITLADAVNIAAGTTTGTKIGTATSQKLSLWNATPIVQPTTAIAAATLVSNLGTPITDTDTFDGYTLKQIVKALREIGALA